MIKRYKLKAKDSVPFLHGEYIHTLQGQYDFLSNDHYSPFVYNGREYRSVTEATNQMQRDGKVINREMILRLIAKKFENNLELRKRLLDTGNAVIIGNGSFMHRTLGKMLATIRNGLRNPIECKLFNTTKIDGSCCEMKCEFCDPYYDLKRKRWWFHRESGRYIYESTEKIKEMGASGLMDVDDRIKTRVVNVKTDEYDVYVGRGSDYGNPFAMEKEVQRDETIEKFRNYAFENTNLRHSFHKLENKLLGCHCSPKNCHGDVIVEIIVNKDY